MIRLLQPGVHENGEVVLFLARLDYRVHVAGVIPGHENLVNRPMQLSPACLVLFHTHRRAFRLNGHIEAIRLARAEHFFPCS